MCVVISRANVVRSIRQTEFCESPVGASLAIRKTNAATKPTTNPVVRGLAPVGLRSGPKTRKCGVSGKPRCLISRLLRGRKGTSFLATGFALLAYSGLNRFTFVYSEAVNSSRSLE